MPPDQVERRLVAILAADVAGYSRLMGTDEEGTLQTLTLYRGVMAELIEQHHGRVVGTAGDSVLAEFASPVQAVRSAVAVQRALDRRNADLEDARRMQFRIGVNLGDVMIQDGDLLGDGVNIAARLEQMAEPGGILVSGAVWEQIDGKLPFPCIYEGDRTAKNIARPVRTYRVEWRSPEMLDLSPEDRPEAPVLPAKPSIAVLPFTNMGSDQEQEYFADGISEDIITALSKCRWMFVIARNTSFVYKGRAVDIKQVGRELGVRYVLEGSVRKAGTRVRITAQLIEAETGAHIWSERYDRDLADAFAVQDEITESVVGSIEPELLEVERQRASRKGPETMDAWDHYMRGMWHFYRFTPENHVQAEREMRLAVERDPNFPQAYVGLGRILSGRILFGWSEDLKADRRACYEAACRAVELDDRDSYAHYIKCFASLLSGRQEAALAEAQKSIDLTPNFALGYFALAVARLFLGRFDQASDPFRRAMRLSPHEPLAFFFANYLALAHYHQGQYEEAVEIARSGLATRPFHTLWRVIAASLGQLGRREEAGAALDEMRRLTPDPAQLGWEASFPYADPAHREQFLEGLRKASLDPADLGAQ